MTDEEAWAETRAQSRRAKKEQLFGVGFLLIVIAGTAVGIAVKKEASLVSRSIAVCASLSVALLTVFTIWRLRRWLNHRFDCPKSDKSALE